MSSIIPLTWPGATRSSLSGFLTTETKRSLIALFGAIQSNQRDRFPAELGRLITLYLVVDNVYLFDVASFPTEPATINYTHLLCAAVSFTSQDCSDSVSLVTSDGVFFIDMTSPTPKIERLSFFNDNTVFQVAEGFEHRAVWCKEGLYSFGSNKYGQLGLGDYLDRQIYYEQVQMPPGSHILSIGVGDHCTWNLCLEGLFVWGRVSPSDLGSSSPTKVFLPETSRVYSVAAARTMIVICFENATVARVTSINPLVYSIISGVVMTPPFQTASGACCVLSSPTQATQIIRMNDVYMHSPIQATVGPISVGTASSPLKIAHSYDENKVMVMYPFALPGHSITMPGRVKAIRLILHQLLVVCEYADCSLCDKVL